MDVMVVTLQEHGFTLNDMELLQEDFIMIQNLACPILFRPPKCNQTCVNGASFSSDKWFADTVYGVPSQVEKIQTEIMTHGPVEAAFTVYNDFLTYKSGVYHHTSGSALGGHAIKIVGWGV